MVALSGAAAPRQSPLLVDVNGDGLTDVVFHDPVTGRAQPCIPSTTGLDCRSSSGIGVGATLLPLDVNGDGRGDLLSYRHATGEVAFLLGTAAGVFTESPVSLRLPSGSELTIADVDGDRRSDVISMDSSGGATVVSSTPVAVLPPPA